jgi:hypothetical protein
MTLFTPPDVGITDAPYGCLRINAQWYSYISGLISAAEELDYWIDDDLDARDVITELINSYDVIPCPDGGSSVTELVVSYAYAVSGGLSGASFSAGVLKQIPYNTLVRDDTGESAVDGDGKITLPAGDWQIRIFQAVRTSVSANAHMRIVDSSANLKESYTLTVNVRTSFAWAWMITSDGETPIQIMVKCDQNAVLGQYPGDGEDWIAGSVEFRKLEA